MFPVGWSSQDRAPDSVPPQAGHPVPRGRGRRISMERLGGAPGRLGMTFFTDFFALLLQVFQPLLDIITQLLGGFFPAA